MSQTDREWPGAREEWVVEGGAPSPEQARIVRALADALAAEDVDIDAVTQEAAEAVANLYGDGVFVALLSEDGTRLRPVGAHHPDPHARREALKVPEVELRAKDGFFAHIAETGMPLFLPDVATKDAIRRRPELGAYAAVAGLRSAILVPLRARGRVFGTLNLVRANPMTQGFRTDQAFLQEIADRLALGIDAWRRAPAAERTEPVPTAVRGHGTITPRELEILDLIARGLTNREIGERLHLSVRTVEWHRERLQLKLGVSGRAALVEVARKLQLGG